MSEKKGRGQLEMSNITYRENEPDENFWGRFITLVTVMVSDHPQAALAKHKAEQMLIARGYGRSDIPADIDTWGYGGWGPLINKLDIPQGDPHVVLFRQALGVFRDYRSDGIFHGRYWMRD